MRRRAYLAGGVGLVITLAGCSMIPKIDPTDESTDTPSEETPTLEPTSSPEEDTTAATENGTPQWGEETVSLENNEPEAVVRTFYEALYAGDSDTANKLLHNDSSVSRYTQGSLSNLRSYEYEIEEMQRVEDESDGASVTLTFTLVLTDADGSVQRREEKVELRLSGDDWKIWV
ncbi:NTF2-like N-terminal transpeptidase domain-containing protein [Haloarcula sp. K1]|uniref:NTF2-like N-terminal transpeptidase domain-containing protein n=1 Tax=Haloarcula sp. K1 TaxID=1622207 RepID=UPI000AF52E3E|nr:NTF2-like N-terminal transpeptidase domain-containing protein [Haloarcula sp. K1]